jgi:hypothetical protein
MSSMTDQGQVEKFILTIFTKAVKADQFTMALRALTMYGIVIHAFSNEALESVVESVQGSTYFMESKLALLKLFLPKVTF